jgi:cation:H+ antiporter
MVHNLFILAFSFVVIIVGAELFTNGVEWLGVRLRLSEAAVGSVLAAVGTALPETLIPFVALVLFREADSHEIGLGAILGAPFMLSTLAFFVTALAAWGYRKRRDTGWRLRINRSILSRDLAFFLPLYGSAIAVSFLRPGHWGRPALAVLLLAAYGCYLYLNLRETAEGEKEEPLVLNLVWAALPLLPPGPPDHEAHRARRRLLVRRPPTMRAVSSQVVLAAALIIGGAYIFVDATREIAAAVGFSPMVIALIIAPVATELPEKFNSVIWVREGRGTLALGNITGAMVFQSTFPVTLGMLLTSWHFGGHPAGGAALLSAGIAMGSALILLVTVRVSRSDTIGPWALAGGLLWWLLFVLYTVIRVAR